VVRYAGMTVLHQQNQANLDSLDRSVQRSIEPQKLQKGALLYSSAQYPAKSVQLCVGLSSSLGLCAEWPKTEIWILLLLALVTLLLEPLY
jgi:hypothetical protein